jgi:hypothetical protein
MELERIWCRCRRGDLAGVLGGHRVGHCFTRRGEVVADTPASDGFSALIVRGELFWRATRCAVQQELLERITESTIKLFILDLLHQSSIRSREYGIWNLLRPPLISTLPEINDNFWTPSDNFASLHRSSALMLTQMKTHQTEREYPLKTKLNNRNNLRFKKTLPRSVYNYILLHQLYMQTSFSEFDCTRSKETQRHSESVVSLHEVTKSYPVNNEGEIVEDMSIAGYTS